ncbi:hypothetical protein MKY66_06785 [Paenibacillus sp. FSL R5-0766]|uniref:hypothetical protein n=1 Tax=unclassified Paenibacillus TaxID=185978 RepID=UPI00096D680D|nr:hypothetical protein [Paenibacillus sp. FSL R5-0765]OMF66377.1 hypothetical protein BK141_05515 [Paenibacillus sp. FSL R5-0765]
MSGSIGRLDSLSVSGSYAYWTNTTNSAPSTMTGSGSFNGDVTTFRGFSYVQLRSIEFITSAPITVTAPVTGATPSTTATVGTANFTARTVTWSPDEEAFAGSTAYTATVTLTANSGYVFAAMLTTQRLTARLLQ